MLHQHKKEGFVAVAIALLLGVAVSTSGLYVTKNNGAKGAVLGASVTNASVKVSVKKVQTYPTDVVTQIKRVSVTITVLNNSGRNLQISPGLQMQLLDKNGASHPVTAAYLRSKSHIGGTLKSGASWTQAIDFDLFSSQTPASFVYQPEPSSSGVNIAL